MKRLLFLVLVVAKTLHSAATPAPVPAPRRARVIPAGAAIPPTGLAGVAVPGRPGAVATPTLYPGLLEYAQEQKQIAAEIARARRNDGQGILRLPTSGGRSGVTGLTPTTPPAATPVAPVPLPTAPVVATPARAPIPAASENQHMLDIINNTGNTLTLTVQDTIGQRHNTEINPENPLISVEVQDNAQSIFAESGMSAPASITNGVTGVVINNNPTGITNYTITSLIPTYEQYALVYNQSSQEQLAVLTIEVPSGGLMGYLPGFLGGTHNLRISKVIQPQQACLLEVPQITTSIDSHNTPTILAPASVNLSVPSSNDANAYTVNLTGHNSFVVTQENNLVLSS